MPDSSHFITANTVHLSFPRTQPERKKGNRPVLWVLLGLLVFAGQIGVFHGVYYTLDSLRPIEEIRVNSELPPDVRPPDFPAVPRTSPSAAPQIGQGGGDATFRIIDVPPPSAAPQDDSAVRLPLTVSQIAAYVTPCVVTVLSTTAQGEGSGTGVIFAQDGYILTNAHVVSQAWDIMIVLHDGANYPAVLIGTDSTTDLAVLKIEASDLSPAEFGNSDRLVVGDPVVVIGNPLGVEFQSTVTTGIISALNRSLPIGGRTMDLLQTSASVNPGNSGGPLINEYGQVVGIINAKIMGDTASTVEGIGFAIPTSSVASIIDDLILIGYVPGRPVIGITGTESYNPPGVAVASVDPNCDAARKGLRFGDIITAVNGIQVATVADVNDIKKDLGVGEALILTVHRGDRIFDVEILLMDEGLLEREE